MHSILEWDYAIFQWINSHQSYYLIIIFKIISGKLTWIPLYLFLVYKLYKQLGKKVLWSIILLAILIISSDLIATYTKDTVMRPRPCNPDSYFEGNVNTVDKNYQTEHHFCTNQYGFYSGHSVNNAAAYMFFLVWFLKLKKNKIKLLLLALWPLSIAYSRIYLGLHYPTDVIAGIIIGSITAYVYYIANVKIYRYKSF
jgi:undecaprenyl-diphosphatase